MGRKIALKFSASRGHEVGYTPSIGHKHHPKDYCVGLKVYLGPDAGLLLCRCHFREIERLCLLCTLAKLGMVCGFDDERQASEWMQLDASNLYHMGLVLLQAVTPSAASGLRCS